MLRRWVSNVKWMGNETFILLHVEWLVGGRLSGDWTLCPSTFTDLSYT